MVDEFLGRLRRAVERRLMADVPIGFFLSGGLDSSLSTVLAAELSPRPVKTFTLTYAQASTTAGQEDDRRWARWVADRFGTEHHEETLECRSCAEHLPRILSCFGGPAGGGVWTFDVSGSV